MNQSYIRKRLQWKPDRIVNVNAIEESLQIIRKNPRVGELQAELAPGEVPGESLLQVRVREARAESVLLRFDNYQATTLGSARGSTGFNHDNLTGRGDTLAGTVRVTHGLRAAAVGYTLPLNAHDSALSFDADVSRSTVVEEPFNGLDIRSRLETYGVTLSHPLHRSKTAEFDVSLAAELRRSQSFLLGSGFQFTDELTEQGVARDSVLRFGQSWTLSGVHQALAIRNSLSVGLAAFGATRNPAGIGDGQFVALLNQFQWARRMPFWRGNGQWIVRSDTQLTNQPLLGMEKFALGGHSSVRGYLENELVRDNGLIVSAEVRLPLVASADGATGLEVAVFADGGRGWNGDPAVRDSKTLSSAGPGLRWRLRHIFQAEVYWGHKFAQTSPSVHRNTLQGRGIHAGISWQIP